MTEYSLHTGIKNWYSNMGAKVETKLQNYVIDAIKDGLLIEIQTTNLSAIKSKLIKLISTHKVRLVYPIAKLKWIVYQTKSGEFINKRKSPKKGKAIDLFAEMVHIAELFNFDNFSFKILLIEEEEIRCKDGKGSWRRKGISIKNRKLIRIINTIIFDNKNDLLNFLPNNLVEPFTNKYLAKKLKISIRLARKVTYCLRKMNLLMISGKKKRELLFKLKKNTKKD